MIKPGFLLMLPVLLLTACQAPPVETTIPETTAVTQPTEPPFGVILPGEIYSSVAPPEPGEGVWYVENAEELAQVNFDGCAGVPTLCITAPIVLEDPFVIDRPVNLYYYSDRTDAADFSGAGIVISTREPGQIYIGSTSAHLLAAGFLTVDTPFCDLIWEGDLLPEQADLDCFCNARTVNGTPGPLGGTGQAVSSMELINTKTQTPYAGSAFTLHGNVLTFCYPLLVSDTELSQATLLFTSGENSQQLQCDLTQNQTVILSDGSSERTYLLTAQRLSYELPVMQIYTDDGRGITSKETYTHATLYIDGQGYPTQIRGRGNSSWTQFPKKSYRIKLDSGASLFGLAENRDWVLVSAYTDKSLLRNCVAHDISAALDGLTFTPTHTLVNLYLNGEYLGVYTFAEKIEAGNGRVDLSAVDSSKPLDENDTGFLIEIGWDYDSPNVYARDFFDAQLVKRLYVKDPEIPYAYTPQMIYIMEYIFDTEHAIVTGRGWEGYIDLNNWVDWFLVAELTFNTESAFYRSCYLWKAPGGKLMLGPVWDFDMAFGNHNVDPSYSSWCSTSTPWYEGVNWMDHLIRREGFQTAVKARWNEVKDLLLATALVSIDTHSASLEGSQQQNFLRWDIMAKRVGEAKVNPKEYFTYESQVQYLRDFITNRWSWMDQKINETFGVQ